MRSYPVKENHIGSFTYYLLLTYLLTTLYNRINLMILRKTAKMHCKRVTDYNYVTYNLIIFVIVKTGIIKLYFFVINYNDAQLWCDSGREGGDIGLFITLVPRVL